jgi:hypothetical protein
MALRKPKDDGRPADLGRASQLLLKKECLFFPPSAMKNINGSFCQ